MATHRIWLFCVLGGTGILIVTLLALTANAQLPIEYGICESAPVNCGNQNCWVIWEQDTDCPTGYACNSIQCNGNGAMIQACVQTKNVHSPSCNQTANMVNCAVPCTAWFGDCVDTNMGCNAPSCGSSGGTFFQGGVQIPTCT
jgi:hypothetical protein